MASRFSELHRQITDQIAKAIEAGAGEYRMPWHVLSAQGIPSLPHNPVGRYSYNGINVLTLLCAQQTKGFRTSQWASYRQWQSVGRQVRRGESGTPTVTYRKLEPFSEAIGEKKLDAAEPGGRTRLCLVRSGTVFNVDQVEGEEPSAGICGADPEPFPVAAALIERSGAVIRPNRAHACYVPAIDEIHLPPRTAFVSEHAYYGVAFHELTHWTGHPKRCARDLTGRFGSDSYAMEELIAELGSAFLSSEVGLAAEPRADHAQYIDSWLRVLKADCKAIFLASRRATEAAAHLLRGGESVAESPRP